MGVATAANSTSDTPCTPINPQTTSTLLSVPQDQLLILPVDIHLSSIIIHAFALLDSGAAGNFISATLVKRFSVPTRKLVTPRQLVLINGSKPAMDLTQETLPLSVHINQHQELLSFDVAPIANYSLILGMPWLSTHNPQVDWPSGLLIFRSQHCRNNCSVSPGFSILGQRLNPDIYSMATDATTISAITPARSPCNVQLPAEFQDFTDVFDPLLAQELPPLRDLDFQCSIPLRNESDLPPPQPIYRLTQPEEQELLKLIQINLANGYIVPSKSPIA
jgi:hypothetical protein